MGSVGIKIKGGFILCLPKQRLVTSVTALTLGCGFTFGLSPVFADSNQNYVSSKPVHSIQKQEQELLLDMLSR